jgi:hypothetical protein
MLGYGNHGAVIQIIVAELQHINEHAGEIFCPETFDANPNHRRTGCS